MRYTIGMRANRSRAETRVMFQVLQYRGIREGWLPVGQPRDPKRAAELARLADRVWPQKVHKIETRP